MSKQAKPSRWLTPSEIESLRQDARQASARVDQLLDELDAKAKQRTPKAPAA